MEPLMFVELVGRDGQVISRNEVAPDAFPLTIRLEGDRVTASRGVSSGPYATAGGTASVPKVGRPLRTPAGALGTSVLTIAVFVMTAYATSYGGKNGAEFLGIALVTFFALLMWAGLWALGGRIARNPAHFRDQLVWTCFAALAFMVVHSVYTWGEFLFPASKVVGLLTTTLLIALCATVLYGHLTIASRMVARRRWIVAAGFIAIFGVISGIGAYASKDKFDTDLDYTAALRPLDARYIPSESAEEFVGSIGDLKKEVDEAATKK
jgi:hypothetical protein